MRNLSILAMVAVLGLVVTMWALSLLEGPAKAAGGQDFTLFTSETDDYVTCTGNGKSRFEMYVLAYNLGADGGTALRATFTDGDFIPFEVPPGTSLGFTQVAGSSVFDQTIVLDVLDNSKNVNPIVMWVSVRGGGATCSATALP